VASSGDISQIRKEGAMESFEEFSFRRAREERLKAARAKYQAAASFNLALASFFEEQGRKVQIPVMGGRSPSDDENS